MKHGGRSCEEIDAQLRELVERIEALKRVQEALCASEHRYHVLAEATPQLIWTALPDGSCDYANSRWEEYGGLAAREYLDKGLEQLLHPDDRQRVSGSWSQAVESGVGADFDCRLRGQDGFYRWFKVRTVPLRDEAGQITKWFGACTDITDLVEARQALTRSQQELEGLYGSARPI
jgi:PAS domain S-box-containing protein